MKSKFLSQAGGEMLRSIFEEYTDIGYQLWKNVKDNIKEN